MKDSEITTSFSNGVINLIPNENQNMIITNYIYQYCSMQLDYTYADEKIILRSYGISSSDTKGSTVLKVIGIKY